MSIAGPTASTSRHYARPGKSERSGSWRWVQHAVSVAVISVVAITALQLGLNGPDVSPVQPAPLSVAPANGAGVAAVPEEQTFPAPNTGRTNRGGHGRGGP
jgi:hypothetical protein